MEGTGRRGRRVTAWPLALIAIAIRGLVCAGQGQARKLDRASASSHVWLTCLLIFAFMGPSAVRADDTPRSTCAAIAPRLLEIYLARGVSTLPLTERERINVSHYLSARKDPDRSRIYLYRSRHSWEPEPNLSLIFPTRDCERSCIGTAILPRLGGFDLVDFSYRKNLIARPYNGEPETIDGFQEKRSTSYILMDPHERRLVAFFDFQRLPLAIPWNKETLKQAQSVRSSHSVLENSPIRHRNYLACYKNVFEVNGFIP
jgi:hypothetical protein